MNFDHIIVGHGLAGAALAIALRSHGRTVCVFDEGKHATASRVAAGLMTPITGKRFALTPRWNELWPVAVEFYESFAERTGQAVLTQTPAVRLFRDAEESQRFEKRRMAMEEFTEAPEPTDGFANEHGCIQMCQTGRLNVSKFLDIAAADSDTVFRGDVTVAPDDVRVEDDRIRIGDVSASRLTWCCGYRSRSNRWFPDVSFEAAKGEIITIRCPGLGEARTVHANGLWMAPAGDDTYRVGATYEWDELNCIPTAAARQELTERAGRFLNMSFEVVDHVAAVRPIVHGRQPVVGVSQGDPRLACINGLGSKGALFAPYIAQMYAEHLEGTRAIDPVYDLYRRSS